MLREGLAATGPSCIAADTPVMAGLSTDQVVIDVVAVAARLTARKAAAAEHAQQEQTGVPCALKHLNHPDARFCAECGLPMGAALPSAGEPMRPKPAAMLTPAERAERERDHAEAMAVAALFEHAPQQFVPSKGEGILIHFVADGLTAFGQVWYRGQELAIGPDHPRWAEALGWITLDKYGQIDRWGEQKFDFGPWPGRRSYTEALGSFEQLSGTDAQGNKVLLSGPTEQQLRDADEAERRRGRAVPAPAML